MATRDTVEDADKIDAFELVRAVRPPGCQPGTPAERQAAARYLASHLPRTMETMFGQVSLGWVSSPGTFGGARWWFCCPQCQQRVRLLHRPYGCFAFACRGCWDLTYESRQQWGTTFGAAMTALAKVGRAQVALERAQRPRTRAKTRARAEQRLVAAWLEAREALAWQSAVRRRYIERTARQLGLTESLPSLDQVRAWEQERWRRLLEVTPSLV